MTQEFAEKFVRYWLNVWKRDGSTYDIAYELQIPHANVLATAATLRGQGVNLPEIKKNLDVQKLNNLIENTRRY